ncbi:hypothetical protein THAOC_02792 [Thalassiosira oceanica]|uniref:Uncharacterized protein n=1 Tax=Thalassiosira oceanica TaxID=159749 RepID=K0TQ60_THAOC|nr:hypothetical protein THAOC_02792 [Thalassiosira oceanica]|eukprot:EJK75482.1 hypothetical protein THAOC_02792 [Thalassiosira oceanica]
MAADRRSSAVRDVRESTQASLGQGNARVNRDRGDKDGAVRGGRMTNGVAAVGRGTPLRSPSTLNKRPAPPFSGPWGPSPLAGWPSPQGPCTKPNEGRPNLKRDAAVERYKPKIFNKPRRPIQCPHPQGHLSLVFRSKGFGQRSRTRDVGSLGRNVDFI